MRGISPPALDNCSCWFLVMILSGGCFVCGEGVIAKESGKAIRIVPISEDTVVAGLGERAVFWVVVVRWSGAVTDRVSAGGSGSTVLWRKGHRRF